MIVTNWKDAPTTSGNYVLHTRDGGFYVGTARKFRDRLGNHARGSGKDSHHPFREALLLPCQKNRKGLEEALIRDPEIFPYLLGQNIEVKRRKGKVPDSIRKSVLSFIEARYRNKKPSLCQVFLDVWENGRTDPEDEAYQWTKTTLSSRFHSYRSGERSTRGPLFPRIELFDSVEPSGKHPCKCGSPDAWECWSKVRREVLLGHGREQNLETIDAKHGYYCFRGARRGDFRKHDRLAIMSGLYLSKGPPSLRVIRGALGDFESTFTLHKREALSEEDERTAQEEYAYLRNLELI